MSWRQIPAALDDRGEHLRDDGPHTQRQPIDYHRLATEVMRQCDAVARCSEEPNRVTRRCFTTAMQQVHQELSDWMLMAGLAPRRDEASNLIGRHASSEGDRVLLLGSHLDSVPGAGKYDGVLGVLMGVAVARALRDTRLPFHLDVIGFCEEEGVRFSKPYLGSSAVAGCFQQEWLDRVDQQGANLREAMTSFGVAPERIHTAAYPSEQVIGYLEPHLEQGPVLQRSGKPIGVVARIAGQSRLRLEFRGEAAHAGTTPMLGRCDALVAAAAFVSAVRTVARRTEGLRATVGSIKNFPNATNVVPARVELSLDVRHPLDGPREAAIDAMLAEAGQIAHIEGCQFALLEDAAQDAVAVDDGLTSLLRDSVADCGCQPLSVPSGAGHDAVIMASRFPVAMLFVRHPDAVSHHPDERVDTADVATGIEALTRFVLRVAKQYQSTNPPTAATK